MTKNQIDYAKYVEDSRHNRAMEQETIRSDRANEKIQQYAQDVNRAHYERSDAYNAEHLGRQDQINAGHYIRIDEETKRANKAKEDLTRMATVETWRHNQELERLTDMSNRISQKHFTVSDANTAESNRISGLRQAEDARHQQMMDQIDYARALTDIESTIIKEDLTMAQTANYQASTDLINAQAHTEAARYYSVLNDATLKESQRDLNAALAVSEKYKVGAQYGNMASNLISSIFGYRGAVPLGMSTQNSSLGLLDEAERSWRYGQ